jgi:hypothetical protein
MEQRMRAIEEGRELLNRKNDEVMYDYQVQFLIKIIIG